MAAKTELHRDDQNALYEDKERDSKPFLDMAGNKDHFKLFVVEDPEARARRLIEEHLYLLSTSAPQDHCRRIELKAPNVLRGHQDHGGDASLSSSSRHSKSLMQQLPLPLSEASMNEGGPTLLKPALMATMSSVCCACHQLPQPTCRRSTGHQRGHAPAHLPATHG